MPGFNESNFLQALGWAVLNSLWQMALLWVCYQLILGIITLKPGKKAGLATGLVMAGFAWFLYTFFSIFLTASATNPIHSIAQAFINDETWKNWIEKSLPIASTLYLLLLVIPIIQFIRNYHYVHTIRTRGLSKIDAEWRMFIKKLSARMGIQRTVRVWLSELVESPVTIGYLKPVILIPVAAINNLSLQQVEAVLLHELSHIRRADYLFNLIINFIKTILYFNPFVRLFSISIESERENSCDEMVMQFQYKPHDYASALLILERSGITRHEMMIAASGPKNNLLERIETILGIQKRKLFSYRRLTGAIAIFVSVLFLNAFLFLNKQEEGNIFFGLNNSYNPYYYLGGNEEPRKEIEVSSVKTSARNLAVIKPGVKKKVTPAPVKGIPDDNYAVSENITPGFYNVSYTEPVLPELEADQEENVKGALEATKKVLEEKEWKEIEKSFADILNSGEKSKLRTQHKKEFNKVDWQKLEDKLRLSYNSIDWEKINGQLYSSLAQIKIDSIQSVISLAMSDLGKIEKWMKENNVTCIPDSDITIHSVNAIQRKAQLQLNKLKAAKQKKIVRI